MVRLGCSLAHEGQAQQRAQQFRQAAYDAGFRTPDGGMAERTYAEALALAVKGA